MSIVCRGDVVIMIDEVSLGDGSWTLPGVTAYDEMDGDLTADVSAFGAGSVNVYRETPPGAPYVVKYTSKDAAGTPPSFLRCYLRPKCDDILASHSIPPHLG